MDPVTNDRVRQADAAITETPATNGHAESSTAAAPDSKAAETRLEIEEHIATIQGFLTRFITLLAYRSATHDQSKLEEPEFSAFAEVPRRSSEIPYGSPAYIERLKLLKPALDHHYKVSRHHPEHFDNGIQGMNLIDLVEMYADWLGSWLDYGTGDFESSIEHNRKRFAFSGDLEAIFKNTTEALLGHSNPRLGGPEAEGDAP